ncbi:MAG: radical SAM protein [Clostridiales bacterium]|nr:radical SAM protein [Clostridiales bacterium]
MKVLLVRPNTPKQSINLQSFMICEPLELEYVASSLLEHNHEVDLVDMLLEKKPLTYFLKQKDYDMVCLTAYITTVGVVKEYAKIIKEYNQKIITCVGGVHAEVVPTDFTDKNIDYVLWANGVETLISIAEHYPKIDVHLIPGIYVQGKNKPTAVNGSLPFPNRKITAKYRNHYNYIYHNNCATIKTSFGCPYKCKFCFCTQICEYSARKIDSVLDELETIEEENVFIVDDNFLISRERILKFVDGLEKRNIKKHYIAFGRADFIAENEDLIVLLHEHGFDAFFVGIESFKDSELSDYTKKSSVEINVKAVNILEKNGLQCYSGLIVGEDWVKKDFDTLIKHLNTFDHPLVNIQPITPMPGTPLFDEYNHEIVVPREKYAWWDMAHVVFKPLNMSKRLYYYHIVRAYLKTSANKKQRKFIKERYGKKVYNRVKKGAAKIFFQYVRLMIFSR